MPKITLKAARVNAGLTQGQMADRLGVSLRTVVAWETGEKQIRQGYVHAYSNITGFAVNDFLLPNEYAMRTGESEVRK